VYLEIVRIIPATVIVVVAFATANWAQGQLLTPAAMLAQTATAVPAPAKPGVQAPSPSENQPVDTLPRKYVDLWNTGDFTQMKSFFSPFFLTSHGHRVRVNADMLRRVISFWRKSMPDLNFKIEDTLIQGDTVAMRLTLRGTYKSVLFPFTIQPGAADPQRTIHAGEMLFFRIKDGKIAEIWEEYDELVMRAQMGAIWSAPKKSTAPSSKLAPKPLPPSPNP